MREYQPCGEITILLQPEDSVVLTDDTQRAQTSLNFLPMSKSSLKLLRGPAPSTSTALTWPLPCSDPIVRLASRSHYSSSPHWAAELHLVDFLKSKTSYRMIITKRELSLCFRLSDTAFVHEARSKALHWTPVLNSDTKDTQHLWGTCTTSCNTKRLPENCNQNSGEQTKTLREKTQQRWRKSSTTFYGQNDQSDNRTFFPLV